MNLYLMLKLVHILSATLLFGTGLGSAFFLWRAHRSRNVAAIAAAAYNVVLADWLFTVPTVILQPLTGLGLMYLGGIGFAEPWIAAALVLYAVAGLCWLPVVWLQIQVRAFAKTALAHGAADLPPRYDRYMALWFALGWPAFASMVLTFYLMVYKPDLW